MKEQLCGEENKKQSSVMKVVRHCEEASRIKAGFADEAIPILRSATVVAWGLLRHSNAQPSLFLGMKELFKVTDLK